MRGFDYQNTSFNYLVLDKYVQGQNFCENKMIRTFFSFVLGGEVVAYESDTNR